MRLIDWIIVLLPVAMVVGLGWHARKYVHGVADFLSAGRTCGRYVVCASDVANALAIIGLVGYAVGTYLGLLLSLLFTVI